MRWLLCVFFFFFKTFLVKVVTWLGKWHVIAVWFDNLDIAYNFAYISAVAHMLDSKKETQQMSQICFQRFRRGSYCLHPIGRMRCPHHHCWRWGETVSRKALAGHMQSLVGPRQRYKLYLYMFIIIISNVIYTTTTRWWSSFQEMLGLCYRFGQVLFM